MERVDQGNPIIVDADSGEVHIRPSSEVIAAYGDKARFQARRHRKYRALRDKPAVTKDGQRIELHINAGLLMDVPHLAESGADGIGLFRTELQFMVSATLPRLERQTQMYRAVVAEAGGKPVVFRTLDVGGDKVLPYLRQPAGGEPGARLARHPPRRSTGPGLLRTQVRALLRATAGQELRLLLPMVTAVGEVDMARALIDRELDLLRRRGAAGPTKVLLGVMIEVPSLLLRARRPAAARRLRLGRQQRPAAVFLRRRPQQHPRRRRATMPCRPPPLRALARHRRGRKRHARRRSACAARWPAGRSRPWR